ncbi:hypothetical protein M9458_018715, partial [Cirrhinus mrigala]
MRTLNIAPRHYCAPTLNMANRKKNPIISSLAAYDDDDDSDQDSNPDTDDQ